MFAPRGYAVFTEVNELFGQWSSEALPYLGGRPDWIMQSRRAHLWHDLRTEFFRTCPSLSVASPTGQLMRVSRSLCVVGGEEHDDPERRFYVFLDQATWVVRVRHALEHLRTAEAAPLIVMARSEGELVAEGSVFQYFEGWALTCLNRDVPSSMEDLGFSVGFPTNPVPPPDREIIAEIVRQFDQGIRKKIGRAHV